MKKNKSQSPMLIEERRQHILALAREHGRVLVDELSEKLQLSTVTLRTDLNFLQSKELLVRTHGGALLGQPGALADSASDEKEWWLHEEKTKISKAASTMGAFVQCVSLDSGTTT